MERPKLDFTFHILTIIYRLNNQEKYHYDGMVLEYLTYSNVQFGCFLFILLYIIF